MVFLGTKNEELQDRRRKLCGLIYRGIPLNQAAKNLAEKYGVQQNTVKEDWYRRKDWLSDLFEIELENAELALLDIMAQEKEIQRELWGMYRRHENPNVKMGLLKNIRDCNNNLVNVMKDLGIIEKDGGINIDINNTNAQVSIEKREESVVDEIEKYREAITDMPE